VCVKGLSLKLDLVEKVAIASVMLVARSGLMRSSSGTTVEISSMKPSKFAMPPLPSSWVIPLARRSAAC